jgi:RbcX protein
MDLKQIAKDTTKVLSSYLTYQAVRVVISQLSETNPPVAIWLNDFSLTSKIQDGEQYIRDLLKLKPELAFRVMTVREHLTTEISDFFPEMLRAAIMQGNIEHRRQYLERITQLSVPEPTADDHPLSDRPTDSES